MLYGYNLIMDARKEVKILLSKKALTMKKLAEKLSDKTGKYYSPQNLNYRLASNSLKLAEMSEICDILGFKIDFVEIN